jgi:dTDP-4-amino-4,6-dideoxygalactose transaminase
MTVPLLDLTRQYESIRDELEAAVLGVLRSTRYIGGPQIEALENEIAAYVHSQHGIAMSSGTDAILCALMALGIGPGDEVVTTAYSFFATAGCVRRLGAKPVFVDIDPVSKNMTPEQMGKALTPRTKAVIAVHLFGRCADVPGMRKICDPRGIPVIEDAAQALGARLQGRMAGSMGQIACFSFFPSKNLGAVGDGGFVSTDDDALAAKMRRLRNHGQSDTYRHEIVGGNFRLDALQAAPLRVKLRYLDRWNQARRQNAARYAQMFEAQGLLDRVTAPVDDPDLHIYHQSVIELDDRDRVAGALREQGIGCAVYYPLTLPGQPCFASDVPAGARFEVADANARRGLALPIFPELTADESERVVTALASALNG